MKRSSFADAGAWIALLMTMSLALTPCPYSLRFQSAFISGSRDHLR
ncbi:MAG: hypothetical protein WBC04_04815 [Candidatus Acidiferrales bacterium]